MAHFYVRVKKQVHYTAIFHGQEPATVSQTAISSRCGISLSSEVDSSATREPCLLLTRAPRSMVGNVSDEILA